MPWNSSDRRTRLPDNWPALRAHTRKRAGGQCEWILTNGTRCTNQGTDCDHITPGDDHSPHNLQWLCRPHHQLKTTRDNAEAQSLRQALRTRPTDQHPGRRTT